MRRWLRAILVSGLLAGGGCRTEGPPTPPPAPAVPIPVTPVTVRAVSPVADDRPGDGELWRLSREPTVVSAGRAAFNASSCRTCHAVGLTGGPGPNLIDQRWLYGGRPSEVFRTIAQGVPSKGMPQWGPVLGPAMIRDIVAYIFSHHREGEPIEVQASFTPFVPSYD